MGLSGAVRVMMHSDVTVPLTLGSPRFEPLCVSEAPPRRHLSGPVVQTGNNDSVRFGPLSKVAQWRSGDHLVSPLSKGHQLFVSFREKQAQSEYPDSLRGLTMTPGLVDGEPRAPASPRARRPSLEAGSLGFTVSVLTWDVEKVTFLWALASSCGRRRQPAVLWLS